MPALRAGTPPLEKCSDEGARQHFAGLTNSALSVCSVFSSHEAEMLLRKDAKHLMFAAAPDDVRDKR